VRCNPVKVILKDIPTSKIQKDAEKNARKNDLSGRGRTKWGNKVSGEKTRKERIKGRRGIFLFRDHTDGKINGKTKNAVAKERGMGRRLLMKLTQDQLEYL